MSYCHIGLPYVPCRQCQHCTTLSVEEAQPHPCACQFHKPCPRAAQYHDAKQLYRGDRSKLLFSVLKMMLHFGQRYQLSVGYTHQIAVKSISADCLNRIPQGDVMGSLYSPQAVSTGTIFLHKNITTYLPHMKKGTFEGLAGVALSRGRDIPGH